MANRFSLTVIRDDFLVLAVGDLSSKECERIREATRDEGTLPDGVKMLVLNQTEVRDLRNAPPPVVDAAEMVQAWLEANL